MAKGRVGLEYSPSMLEPMRPGVVSPDRALWGFTLTFVLRVGVSLTSYSHIVQREPVLRGEGPSLSEGSARARESLTGTITLDNGTI